jgi:hypothetical protein
MKGVIPKQNNYSPHNGHQQAVGIESSDSTSSEEPDQPSSDYRANDTEHDV